MMIPRLVSTAVGYNNRKGHFAALVHRFKFEDGSYLLTSWGITSCVQLFGALAVLINSRNGPENPLAEQLFKAREGTLTQDELEAPGPDSVVSNVWGTLEGEDLFINIYFEKTGVHKRIGILHDDARSLMGYTGNALKQAGVLDGVMTNAYLMLAPILLFTCSVAVADSEIQHHYHNPVNEISYRFLPFLYFITIIDNSTPEKRRVVGGFVFKCAHAAGRPEFTNALLDVIRTTPGFQKMPTAGMSFRTTTIIVPDGLPLTEKECLREFVQQYTKHSVAGSA